MAKWQSWRNILLASMSEIGTKHPSDGTFSPQEPESWASLRAPLGVHRNGDTVTFAVYSRRATRMLLEIYSEPILDEAQFEYFLQKNPDDNVWRACLNNVAHGTLYGFRCW